MAEAISAGICLPVGIQLETRGDTRLIQTDQLISGIPGVGRRARGIRHRDEVAVVIKRRTLRAQRQLLVRGVVIRRVDHIGHAGACKAATRANAPPRLIVAVREIPQRRRPLGVRQRGEPRGRVVAVCDHDAIR